MIPLWLVALRATSETLYEAPSRFWDNLPIATFEVAGPGHSVQSLVLLIDSGANGSFLFPGHSRGSGAISLSVVAGTSRVSIGTVEFAPAPRSKLSTQAEALMSKLGVDGSLGVDFLRTHDVLVNYRQRRIMFSRDQNSLSTGDVPDRLSVPLRGNGVRRTTTTSAIDLTVPPVQVLTLVEQDDIFFLPVSVFAGEPTACLMALDTGTGESALPVDITSKLKPTGAKREIVGIQGKAVTASEFRATISIADSPPRAVSVLGSDARGPILGGNAFRSLALFLQLRFSRALAW